MPWWKVTVMRYVAKASSHWRIVFAPLRYLFISLRVIRFSSKSEKFINTVLTRMGQL